MESSTSGEHQTRIFEFMVECINVYHASDNEDGYGFYTTIRQRAKTMKAGAAEIRRLVLERISASGLLMRHDGLFKTRCRILEIYSFQNGEFEASEVSSGVSLYRMTTAGFLVKEIAFRYYEFIRPHMSIII